MKKKKKDENFHDGNILTIFLIFWPFSSWNSYKVYSYKKSVYCNTKGYLYGDQYKIIYVQFLHNIQGTRVF